ncbi:hypothetical protein [Streptomyces sp. P17]|jgi:hypothetical protein|uniref:hypothetical protein n=1 Tax=Streptomyces sp. P17 TaxID=3074716 RepID=UPI0028F3EBD5|nr:hypothetical protein [Streptomyces sp. P17]MDT9701925.1 hypothetical protein [Streptomyces sp. P17]
MKRNIFGEAQPATTAEIIQALGERDLLAADAMAEIMFNEADEPPFSGWRAEISHADLGAPRIDTLGFETREALEQALRAAGITLIVDY